MPVEIVDGVYDITCVQRETGRIRAFLTDDGTLFDAGYEDTIESLRQGIEETAIEPDRLVVTHADPDHIGGASAIAKTYNLDVFLPHGVDYPAIEADEFYGEGDEIRGFEAIHAPGHRDHQHALIDETRAGGRGLAVLGDAVSGSDQRGLPAGYFHLPPAAYSDDLVLAEQSLVKLLDYEFDIGLVYHGSSVRERASEKLAQYVGPWREMLVD